MNDRLRKLPTYPMEQLSAWKRDLERRGVRVFDFGTGDPREPTPALLKRAMLEGTADVSQYPPTAGTGPLRAAVAGYLRRRFCVAVDPDTEVLATMGSKEALFHLPMTFVQVPSEKDLVLYGEPAYPVYEIGALFAEAWTYPVPLGVHNGYAMDPDALPESVLRRASVVFLNYPHNPTGFCLPDALFARWVEAREQYGFVLVGDECYVDLHYEGPRPRSLLEFGRKGCLAVHSLSKRSGMTGYRSGFVAGDAELIATYRRFRASIGTAPQEFVQAAATVAWTDDAHVRDRVAVFAQKREVLLGSCRARGLQVHGSRAGLYLWIEVPAGVADVDYAARCREVGILVAPGSFFGKGQERYVRLALVPTVEECRDAAAL
ncbi:MAG: aminotransferase class I/II-fold pyridoxal phosphate-dependent enzyme, partial [Planctomycetes bacterium]|nr:aminotransferase class I/II-fold pyridoxal phosphate-dependent enzyme [Planctomycetota bacterium]